MNRLWRLVLALLVLYLADWALTLLGTLHPGFVELNPLAGAYWNHGDTARPLALKLLGVALLLALPLVAVGRKRRRAAETLTAGALLLFLAVDVLSLLQLSGVA